MEGLAGWEFVGGIVTDANYPEGQGSVCYRRVLDFARFLVGKVSVAYDASREGGKTRRDRTLSLGRGHHD